MITIKPDYYDNFKCLMGDCPSSCCTRWQIDVDDKSLSYYNSLNTPFGDYIRTKLDFVDGENRIKVENGRCAFLNKDNLCDLYINIGPEKGAVTCRNFPCVTISSEDIVVESKSSACPYMAEVLVKADKVEYLSSGEWEDEYDKAFVDAFYSVADFSYERINFMKNLDDVLIFSEKLQHSLEKKLDLDEVCIPTDNNSPENYAETLLSYPVVTNRWKAIRQDMADFSWAGADKESYSSLVDDNSMRNIFLYFLHRHFLDSIYDENFYLPVKLAVISVRIIYYAGLMTYCKTGDFTQDDLVRLLYLYSKEIEHDDETINIFYDDISLGMI